MSKDPHEKSPSYGNETIHDVEGKEKSSNFEVSNDNTPLTLKIPEFNNALLLSLNDGEDEKEIASPKFTKNSSIKDSELNCSNDYIENNNTQQNSSRMDYNELVPEIIISNSKTNLHLATPISHKSSTSESRELINQCDIPSNPTIKINPAEPSDKDIPNLQFKQNIDSKDNKDLYNSDKNDSKLGVDNIEQINRKLSREIKLKDPSVIYYSSSQVEMIQIDNENNFESKKKAQINFQNSIESVSRKIENELALSISSEEQGFAKSICSEIPNIINLESIPFPPNINYIDKLSVNENSSENRGPKSAVEHSNTVDSNFSKLGIDNGNDFHKLMPKIPISKQSVLTFNYSNDQSPHNKDTEKFTNGGPSFNGDYEFRVQTNDQESGSNKFPGFNLKSELTSSLEGGIDLEKSETNYPLINLNEDSKSEANPKSTFKKSSKKRFTINDISTKIHEMQDIIELSSIKSALPLASSFLKELPSIFE